MHYVLVEKAIVTKCQISCSKKLKGKISKKAHGFYLSKRTILGDTKKVWLEQMGNKFIVFASSRKWIFFFHFLGFFRRRKRKQKLFTNSKSYQGLSWVL